jgi:ribosomal-protein-alanine N-acetyltransferase
MSLVRIPGTLETERLILRQPGVAEAAVYRQLWTERDHRVPPHRRIDAEGRPTAEDIAAQIQAEVEGPAAELLALERKREGDVIGYCGLTAHGNGSLEEPELAYELLRAAQGSGYATEAGRTVVAWAGEAGYRRLWAGVWDWNVASRRVLDKLGFREVSIVEPSSIYGHTVLTVRDL